MKSAFCIVYVTAPRSASKKIALRILNRRLAACANIIPSIRSHYLWNGKVESAVEDLLVLKSRTALMTKLISFVKSIHPYDVPEVVCVPIVAGHPSYLKWISAETST